MKRPVITNKAPAAIGPYAQANVVGDFIFASGQIPIIPETGELAEGIEAQTHQVLKNISAIMKAAGSDMDHVVKTTVFLKDMNHFAVMNSIYAEYFSMGNYPSRSAVEVSRLPKDVLIEIEVIAERIKPVYTPL